MTHAEYIVLSIEDVFDLSLKALVKAGLSRPHAECVARAITAGERDECAAHGLYRLPGCVETVRAGKLVPDAEPVIAEPTPSLIRADAGFGYSLLAFERAAPLLAEKARKVGVAALVINNCFHFSALWPEIEMLTEMGVVALAMTPSHGWVAPAGGTKGLLGTNPVAFGWPRPGRHPYVFDFATSAAARGEISLHHLAGKPVPEGWGLDSDGRPTTDAGAVLEGAMLAFGGHKGSALATMIELLAGALIGDMTSVESLAFDGGDKAAPCHGELVLAFSPDIMSGGAAEKNAARAEALFAAFAEQGARLPSERRYAARARSLARGVRVPRPLYEKMEALL